MNTHLLLGKTVFITDPLPGCKDANHAEMLFDNMACFATILLDAKNDWIGGLFHQVLASHGYRILRGGCGITPLVIGHSLPGEIDFLITEVGIGNSQSGKDLALNLRVLQPQMKSLFFTLENGTILVSSDPDLFVCWEFSPAKLLMEIATFTKRRYGSRLSAHLHSHRGALKRFRYSPRAKRH